MNGTIILLGGNNSSNAIWLNELGASLSVMYDIHILRYKHWDLNDVEIDFDIEKKRLRSYIKKCKKPYYFVAKSAGAILAMKCIADDTLSPKQCVFIGTPIEWATEKGIEYLSLLGQNKVDTLYIQATSDPMGSADKLKAIIGDRPSLARFKSDNHYYEDIQYLFDTIANFLK
ncbi:MAG: hypothetical protein WCK26_02170 [Candidatus Saccharibacteria bacterium]